MTVAALGPEILAELQAGCSADALFTVLDDLSLRIERESLTSGGEVPGSTAIWVGRLRRIARAKLNAWGWSALADDAERLVSELVTNGFKHATQHHIVFRLVIGTEVLVLEVDDGSPGRPEVRNAGHDAVNGRGLLLVSVVAAAWGVSADGTKTWCALQAPKTGRPV